MKEKYGNQEVISNGGINAPSGYYQDVQAPPYSQQYSYIPYGNAQFKPEKGHSNQPPQNIYYPNNSHPPPMVGNDDGNVRKNNSAEDSNLNASNKRKWNDVFGIIMPIFFASMYAFSTYRIRSNSNDNTSPLWKFYSDYSLGTGPLRLGINPFVALLIIPVITLLILQASSFLFNHNLSPSRVKFLTLLVISSVIIPSASFIFYPSNNGSGKGFIILFILLLLLIFFGYLIYKFMSRNAVIISEFINVSYKGLKSTYTSLVPTFISITLSTALILFTYLTLIKGVSYSPFQLYAINDNNIEMVNISDYKNNYALFKFYRENKLTDLDDFSEYTEYFGKSNSYLKLPASNVILLLISTLYICLFIYQTSTSIVIGYVATFLLNSDQGFANDNKNIVPKSHPVINSTKNALTTNIGSLALFTLVRFLISIVEVVIYLFRMAATEDSNNYFRIIISYLVYYIIKIIDEIVIAINTYATVLNSIYGYKFGKCYNYAIQNVKNYVSGLINAYYAYSWYLRFNLEISVLVSLVINYFIMFSLSHTISSIFKGDYKSFRRELCIVPNDLSDKITSNNFGLPDLPPNYSYNVCSMLGMVDAFILPAIISISFTSALFVSYFQDCCNSILGCLVELPSIASHMSQQLSIYAHSVFNTEIPH